MWAVDPAEQALFDRLGVTRELQPTTDGDDVIVTISTPTRQGRHVPPPHDHLRRERGRRDRPGTGDRHGRTAERGAIELSDYVVGNANDDPRGSNRTFLSLYTGLDVNGATLDGNRLPLELHDEYGLKRAAAFVTVPPGGQLRVVFDIGGPVLMEGAYHLRVLTPALVQPDRVEVRLATDTGQVGAPTLDSETLVGEPQLSPGAAAVDLVGQAEFWFPLRK